ncbi:MAG: cation diffusion facilitator family transporter, partial [Chitinophagaceae bacterium]|nr:cation diffusion facilitator family transporter [Chitinophagaceae bacterium]
MSNDDSKLGKIINNPENLQVYTTAERNNRKSDNSADRMDSKDKNKHWENADKKSKQYLDEERKKGEKRLKDEGRETQKEEALKMGGAALQAVLMQLLAEFMKEIIGKLVIWFKSAQKNLETLLGSIKSAIGSFVSNLKKHVLNAGNTLMATVATAIYGPIVGAIKKVWIMLKQSWKSLKDAVDYIKNPDNKNKPFGILILEVGKIVTAGLAAAGAIALGETIEKGLLAIPGFAFVIPMLGSLASLIGLFLGGLIAGVVGAIAINLIDKAVAKRQTALAVEKEVKKGNEILDKQNTLLFVNEAIKEEIKKNSSETMLSRHKESAILMKDSVDRIFS